MLLRNGRLNFQPSIILECSSLRLYVTRWRSIHIECQSERRLRVYRAPKSSWVIRRRLSLLLYLLNSTLPSLPIDVSQSRKEERTCDERHEMRNYRIFTNANSVRSSKFLYKVWGPGKWTLRKKRNERKREKLRNWFGLGSSKIEDFED